MQFQISYSCAEGHRDNTRPIDQRNETFPHQIDYKNISGRILFYFIHFLEISFSIHIISINSLDYVKS